ncbi:pyruvate/2-oxoglutarate/acetoin dehydrogenase E1 component/TPP-dependent pyruvate/acetoin dehydrogenase alpha subunit [Arcicella rosea]|uniref:3-methyl-2-oxobutanoate dehydrogenase (2-methylpropanoyl-transferring) n=1 Tax=Arcicella rosea TaxID=502909 RepID=A0A841ES69_9BACT|nr:pyruvate/2-oxoglutarate/acetoin dehydrogenase E1 component/TPP-dependent pyruvate/acetoin dehydrogenase alpha subunit [Arcicella rosea]
MENTLLSETIVFTKESVLTDYRVARMSRECSLLVRKEVFAGRAKFGIYGDGKELCQLALARAMKAGDFISGYYRDQTIVAAVGDMTWTQYFSQLYGHPDINFDPHTGGRAMNNHHATRWLDEEGEWVDQTKLFNSAAGVSSTAGQMPRAVGLAYSSKLYRQLPNLQEISEKFTRNGREVCFSTIGDASTSEGMFLECVNASGVLQIPLVMSVWDDGYGISVPSEYQTTKSSISKALAGYQRNEDGAGIEIFTVKAWDYVALMETYQKAATLAREYHIPSLIHVEEVTQQQGHSASGSHERYKSSKRLQFELDYDCNIKFRNWILAEDLATEEELKSIDEEAIKEAKACQKAAWNAYMSSIKPEREDLLSLLYQAAAETENGAEVKKIAEELRKAVNPIHHENVVAARKVLRALRFEDSPAKKGLKKWLEQTDASNDQRFNSSQFSISKHSPLKVQAIQPEYDANSPLVDGREILNKNFDHLFSTNPRIFILGEDVGKIGDVNQTLAGLQEKFGELRVTDTGIREMTIVGQGIGAAMRGLRPIIEIQYLDYIFYPFATLSDDLACLQYRTVGGQKAPLIVRTRGHRLEGIWHSGSPMSVLLGGLKGIHLCVPRNMTQAAGMYNTLLNSDDPAIVIECLNGYRLKEKLPTNLHETRVALGVPEVIREGRDITIVTYGSMCRIVMEAARQLENMDISVEVIDVQTLMPFDISHLIVESIKKTNRVIFADEDMPGGGSAYMMQQVLDEQNAYRYLDAKPVCMAAVPHRPAYSSDGDYFSKPNVENVVDTAYELMSECYPLKFPPIY